MKLTATIECAGDLCADENSRCEFFAEFTDEDGEKGHLCYFLHPNGAAWYGKPMRSAVCKRIFGGAV